LSGLHFREKIPQDCLGEACSDISRVDQLTVFVESDSQRTKGIALAQRVSAYYKLLFRRDLQLQPGFGTARFVNAVGSLRKQAFESILPGGFEQYLARANQMIGHPH